MRHHVALIWVVLPLLACGFMAACGSPSRSPDEQAVITALKTFLESAGESVAPDAGFADLPDEDLLLLTRHPRCFSQQKPSRELVRTLIEINPGSGTGRLSVSRWLDHVAAKAAGVEVAEPVGFFVSRVSFNDDSSRALVYAEDTTPLAGFGALFLLERKQEAWSVLDTCELWLS